MINSDYPRLRKNLNGDTFLEVLDSENDPVSIDVRGVFMVHIGTPKGCATKLAILSCVAGQFPTAHSYVELMDLLAPITEVYQ